MSACAVMAAVAAFLAPPALESPTRIIVLVQGEGVEAGRIQADVERELNLQGASVKSTAELASGLGVAADAAPAPPPNLPDAKTKIAEAEAAYLRGEFDVAATAADDAKKILAPFPAESAFDERVLAGLWHVAAIQQTDAKAAQLGIRELLYDLDPKPKVSADVFPPDFVAFVEAERLNVKKVDIRLTELPAAAQVWVNGRKVDSSTVTVVQHPANKPNVVTVRAPGYRTLVFPLPVTATNASIRAPLALALPPELAEAVRNALAGKADEKNQKSLGALADRPPAASLLLIQARGKAAPTAMLWKNRQLQPISGQSQAALATAVMETFRKPKPSSAGLAIVTEGAMDVSFWQRDLGKVYSLPLAGTGPRVSTDVQWNAFLASGEISYVQYMTPIEASVTGGNDSGKTISTDGSSALRVTAGAGVSRAFGDVTASALVGGHFEQYSTKVLEVASTDAGGEDRPIVGPHMWAGPQAQVRARYELGPIGLVAGVGAVFASTYTEAEPNMSGKDPATDVAPFWRLGGTWAASPKLNVGLLYAGETRTTKFEGEPALRQDPEQTDLVLTDFRTTVALTAAYSF